MSKMLRLALVISILASFVAFLDTSVVNVALPSIARDLGGGLRTQQWVVDAYLLTLGSFILIAGSLSDIFGRKRVMTYGLIGFVVTSVACAVSPSAGFLIGARAVQGVAGALLVPSSLALIISVFKGEQQGRAIGLWSGWTGISFIVGPLLGGYIVDAWSWRGVFWINVIPVAVTLFLLKKLSIEEKLPKNAKVDILGALLCSVGLAGLVYGFIEQPYYGWNSLFVWLPLALGAVLLIVFIWYESKTVSPMLPLELFKTRNFSVGNLATVSIYAGLTVATFIIVVFVQQIAGYSALRAGFTLLPVTLIMFVLSPRFGALAGKYGPRWFMTCGPLLAALGFMLFLRVDQSVLYWRQIFPGVVVFGLGLSMTVAPLTTAVLANIQSKHAGVASAINNAVARIAGLIAIALLGLIVGANPFGSGTSAGVEAFHRAVFAMALLLAAGGVISAIGIQNKTKSATD